MDPSILSALPTDSLYKFMALAGLLILAASLVVPMFYRKRLAFQQYEAESRGAILAKRNNLETEIFEMKQMVATSRLPENIQNLLNLHEAAVDNELEIPREVHEQLGAHMHQYGPDLLPILIQEKQSQIDRWAKHYEAQSEQRKVKLLIEEQMVMDRWRRIGTVLGPALIVAGFAGWHFFLQRHVDHLHALQVAKAAREEKEALQRAPAASVTVSSSVPDEAGQAAGGAQTGVE